MNPKDSESDFESDDASNEDGEQYFSDDYDDDQQQNADDDNDDYEEMEDGKKKVLDKPIFDRPSKYKSKLHREDIMKIKNKEKRLRRKQAKESGRPKQTPRTIESTRVPNEDRVDPEDEEVLNDELLDEMSSYFAKEKQPKVLITTSHNPHRKTMKLCRELKYTIPEAEIRWRKKCSIKRLVKCATVRGYTDILVINEDWRKPNALLHVHLPEGPTAYYRLSSVRFVKQIKNRAKFNNSRPEIIINNMTTRLGHTIGRMLASIFHYEPNFQGKKVVTFHNQRDYIFFRQHLYEFKDNTRVAIRELGPRFTLKLRSLQNGTFDSKYGEFEWTLKRHEQGVNRRKFSL